MDISKGAKSWGFSLKCITKLLFLWQLQTKINLHLSLCLAFYKIQVPYSAAFSFRGRRRFFFNINSNILSWKVFDYFAQLLFIDSIINVDTPGAIFSTLYFWTQVRQKIIFLDDKVLMESWLRIFRHPFIINIHRHTNGYNSFMDNCGWHCLGYFFYSSYLLIWTKVSKASLCTLTWSEDEVYTDMIICLSYCPDR